MKVAMLIDGRYPIFGGGQVHVQELCNGLIKNHDCDIDLFTRKLKDNEGKKYIKNETHNNGKLRIFRIGPTTNFFNLFGRVMGLIFMTLYLYKKTKKEQYDIIHAHAYVSGIPAKIIGFLFRKPVIYTVHGANNLETKNKSILTRIEKRLLTGIKYNQEISVSHQFLQYQNINKNIKIIPNGVNIEKFDNEEVNKKYKGISVLRVGRMSWEKGLDYLIEGINLIPRKILQKENIQINLVGDGEQKKLITGLIKNYNLEDYIKLKGRIEGKELIQEYKKNHFFILPSLSEGQPLTVLEAFAAKIPVIATNVGDNKYFVNNDNGKLIPSENSNAIKEAIELFIEKGKKNLEILGENGYKFVKKNNTRKNIAQKTYNLYKENIKNDK